MNYFRTFRRMYELTGRVRKSDAEFKDWGSRDYPRTAEDQLASYIQKYGRELTCGEGI